MATTADLHVSLTLEGFGHVSYVAHKVGYRQFVDIVMALKEIEDGHLRIQSEELVILRRDSHGKFRAVA